MYFCSERNYITAQRFDITFNIHGLRKKAFKCFALVSILCSITIFFALLLHLYCNFPKNYV